MVKVIKIKGAVENNLKNACRVICQTEGALWGVVNKNRIAASRLQFEIRLSIMQFENVLFRKKDGVARRGGAESIQSKVEFGLAE